MNDVRTAPVFDTEEWHEARREGRLPALPGLEEVRERQRECQIASAWVESHRLRYRLARWLMRGAPKLEHISWL